VLSSGTKFSPRWQHITFDFLVLFLFSKRK
jgi:hypothetical protein